MNAYKIGIVGAGNVGIHLANAFSHVPENSVFLYARSEIDQRHIDKLPGVQFTDDILFTKEKPDVVILAVNDENIAELSKIFKDAEYLLLHTSGSISLDTLLKNKSNHCGILYPLQSFSLQRKLDYSQIPFLIESCNSEDLSRIHNLVSSIGAKWTEVNSEERKKIHVSAVIVNNFVNHLYTLGADYLNKNDLSFELLIPLINETTSKLADDEPAKLQTGPAKRGDLSVIKEHLNLLENHPQLRNLYKSFSDSISNFHRKS